MNYAENNKRHFTYYVTLRRIYENIVEVEKR